MCDPVTLSTLAIASAVTSTAGAGFAALQASAQGRYQAKIANRNAQLSNDAVREEQSATRQEVLDHYRKAGQLKGQQRVAMAAGGIDVNFGSAADLQADTTMMVGEDAARIYDHGAQAVKGLDIQAANYRSQSQASKQSATGALVGGVFNMGATALGGATQYGKLKAQFGAGGGAYGISGSDGIY